MIANRETFLLDRLSRASSGRLKAMDFPRKNERFCFERMRVFFDAPASRVTMTGSENPSWPRALANALCCMRVSSIDDVDR
jgi:hypothetical protein